MQVILSEKEWRDLIEKNGGAKLAIIKEEIEKKIKDMEFTPQYGMSANALAAHSAKVGTLKTVLVRINEIERM